MAATGCLGFCQAGPLMVVYPAGIWYRPEEPEDIDEIVQSHLVDNQPVERLAVVPRVRGVRSAAEPATHLPAGVERPTPPRATVRLVVAVVGRKRCQ
jgi:(2Fe-2S) ferredoxin